MIIDKVKNIRKYVNDFPQLLIVEKIIKSGILSECEIGAYDTEDDSVRYIVSEYETKEKGTNGYEVHQKYADVQIVLSGKEHIDMCDIATATKRSEYDSQSDIQFFDGKLATMYTAEKDNFLLVLPEELHEPGLKLEKSETVRKVVFKLKM